MDFLNIENFKKQTILIVEDSASMRKFIALSLKFLGYKVVLAVDGMDAIEKIPGENIDLVITDLNMPNIDGFSLIEHVRAIEEYKDIPIIVLSSLTEECDIEKSIEMGANSYLMKPFNTQVIQSEVKRLLTK